MEKKKKKGHVAIPFLLAFLLAILGIGGIAVYLFRQLDSDGNGVQKMPGTTIKPSAASDATLLFILDEPSKPEPLTFMLARIRPSEKEIVMIGLPDNMISLVDGRQDTLSGFYSNGGVQQVEAAIKNETQIETDRYIIINSEGFQKICNIFGGAYYQVPKGLMGFTDSNEPQYLGPSQMEKLLCYPLFEQGEIQRSALCGDLIAEMINQTDFDRIVSSMDNNFKTLINMMETDISAIDYNEEKDALKYMYTYGDSNIATFRIATGTIEPQSNVFILDSGFYNGVSEFFEESEQPASEE